MEMTLYELRPTPKPGRVLLVDDDPDFRDMLGTALTRAGFAVHKAHNGYAALTRLRTHPVDLIVTDIIMPEVDGYEVILQLKSLPSRPALIAVSGGSVRLPMELPKMARLLGADAAFMKPLAIEALVNEARRLIGEHRKTTKA